SVALNTARDSGALRLVVSAGAVNEQVVFSTYVDPTTGRVPFFADSRTRQAVASAFNRAGLANSLTVGLMPALESWIPVEHWAHRTATPRAHDPALAAQLLDQAGWVDGNGDGIRDYAGEGGTYACQRGGWSIEPGTPFTPTVVIPAGDTLRAQIAAQLQVELRAVGIDLQIVAVDPSTLFAAGGPLARRDFDLALYSSAIRPDPDGLTRWVGADVYRHPIELNPVHRWQLEDRWLVTEQLIERIAPDSTPRLANDYQGLNTGGWCQDEANLLIVAATEATSQAERQVLYEQHEAIVAEEVPVLPLFSRPRIAAAAPYVCGIVPVPYGPLLWNISTWYLDESGTCAR
ncbi:MAG: hypothetical protein IT326_00055, partial [Anaerolineae bacterium]|nr:hypothetical protein [Anaerolineae bacterium]